MSLVNSSSSRSSSPLSKRWPCSETTSWDREVVLEGEGHGPTIVGSTPLSKEFSGSNAVPANRGPESGRVR